MLATFAVDPLLADQVLPPMDGTYWAMLVSRVLHILGAVILLGGILYLRNVVLRTPSTAGDRSADEAFGGSRAKWAMWVGIATLLLLASGLFNYIMYMRLYDRFDGPYHMMFGIKFLLALVLFYIAAVLAGRTSMADRFRHGMRGWLSISIAIGIAILVIAAIMRTVPHVPKSLAEGAPPLVAPQSDSTTDTTSDPTAADE